MSHGIVRYELTEKGIAAAREIAETERTPANAASDAPARPSVAPVDGVSDEADELRRAGIPWKPLTGAEDDDSIVVYYADVTNALADARRTTEAGRGAGDGDWPRIITKTLDAYWRERDRELGEAGWAISDFLKAFGMWLAKTPGERALRAAIAQHGGVQSAGGVDDSALLDWLMDRVSDDERCWDREAIRDAMKNGYPRREPEGEPSSRERTYTGLDGVKRNWRTQ